MLHDYAPHTPIPNPKPYLKKLNPKPQTLLMQEFVPGKLEDSPVVLTEANPILAVRVTNQEVSWEPFYAKLVGEDGSKNAGVCIQYVCVCVCGVFVCVLVTLAFLYLL
jgi:hypothetical protein